MDMKADECSGPGLMCVDLGVLVGMRRPRLGPRLEPRQALCGPCVSRTGLSPSVCGRRTRVELHMQDIGPRMLPASAALGRGASCRHPCCSFPCVALFAHMVLSIATAVASTSACYVRLIPRSARCLHNKGPPGRVGRTAALLSADCTGARSGYLPLSALSFSSPLGGATSS